MDTDDDHLTDNSDTDHGTNSDDSHGTNSDDDNPSYKLVHEKALVLLFSCRFSTNLNRTNAEEAINILELNPFTDLERFYIAQRGLVYFPDLLQRSPI